MKPKVVVGYDLSDGYAQISYYAPESGEPETVAVVAGTQQYNIPAVLCKRREVNQWFYGREALKVAREGDGALVTGLLSKAVAGEKVLVGEEQFDAAALLTLFMKRSLSLLHFFVGQEQIAAFLITVDRLDRRAVEVLGQAAQALGLKKARICFQSHMESFYHYVIHQPPELWAQDAVLCDFSCGCMKTYRLEWNRRTTPMVAFIDARDYPQMPLPEEAERESRYAQWDAAFLQIVREATAGRLVSSAYLIGDGFDGGWCRDSLKEICRGQRVFQGNNLYSKGACYGAAQKAQDGEEDLSRTPYVFLGSEKLKANVGMRVLRQGEETYLALLDAGYNWFEVQKDCEVILESGNSFELLITPLTGGSPKRVEMVLEGLPQRERGTTRLHVDVRPVAETRIRVRAEDLGFGEIVAATHQVWQEEIAL